MLGSYNTGKRKPFTWGKNSEQRENCSLKENNVWIFPLISRGWKGLLLMKNGFGGGDFILEIFSSEQLLNRTWKCDSSTRLQNCSRSDTWWDCLLHLWLCTRQPKSFLSRDARPAVHTCSIKAFNKHGLVTSASFRVCICSRHRQQFFKRPLSSVISLQRATH